MWFRRTEFPSAEPAGWPVSIFRLGSTASRGEGDKALRDQLKALASERRRFGYRRLFVLLRREPLLTGDATARRLRVINRRYDLLVQNGSMPVSRCGQGVSNRGRHAPFGKEALYYNAHLA